MVQRQGSPQTPVLFLHKTEAKSVQKMFTEFAHKKQAKTLVIPISGTGAAVERTAKKSIQKGMNEVTPTKI